MMSFTLHLDFKNTIKNNISPKKALDKLSDIHKIADLHPKVKSVECIEGNCWKWRMTPSGARGSYFDIIYGCQYTISDDDFSIRWFPIKEIGNAIVEGHWIIHQDYAEIYLDIKIEVPFPKVFSGFANAVANKAFAISMKSHLKLLEELIRVE